MHTDYKRDPLRSELLALYAEVDALLAPYSCEGSAECCDFGITGREPYPTPIELAEVKLAMRAASVVVAAASRKRLPIAGATARRCPLLSDAGRCRVYASRPFGCRTYFCERIAPLGSRLPRKEILRLSRDVADLAARFAPHDPGPRPLTRALK